MHLSIVLPERKTIDSIDSFEEVNTIDCFSRYLRKPDTIDLASIVSIFYRCLRNSNLCGQLGTAYFKPQQNLELSEATEIRTASRN
ncbi:hypothetical protein AVEN_158726-1 [Araneus ventricosus]|uniref:Uncharacterized protein n=1 Tax=Araneus ventricosus TaxID=182803 RepID=A0A4Y2WW42_ARAVE|nr:hypothetical protein AVEN_109745-1 [Araneus ventricosus]GBO40274.1 hypothetical protein AVEN_158726-1 [Araneus ventricosus]